MTHFDVDRDRIGAIERGPRGHAILRWLVRYLARRRRAAMRAKLDSLNDDILRDIGLGRDSIAAMAERSTHFTQGPAFR